MYEPKHQLQNSEEHLTVRCAVEPSWKFLELQECQSHNLEEEEMELILRVLLLHKMCMDQKRLLQVQE